ncbi:MAG: virulence factor [Burkholderiaceae bacterium]|nr:virulence factor [Burkholderiaceae bacterium]
MKSLIATPARRAGVRTLTFLLYAGLGLWFTDDQFSSTGVFPTPGEIMARLLILPTVAAVLSVALLSSCASVPVIRNEPAQPVAAPLEAKAPHMAQVVGLQWLNPLQRRDYPTEWQLLWTLGLVKPNKNDEKVIEKPGKFSKLQIISSIANGWNGTRPFKEYQEQYIDQVFRLMRSNYFSTSDYFYNVHGRDSKQTWRELAGIRVEYTLPPERLDTITATTCVKDSIVGYFDIGNPNFPTLWTRDTPPDVRVTAGGPNAGFTSLTAALDYLQARPTETVWVMGGDTPSYPAKEDQLNENMVLLVLAGPGFKTERAPLAWIGYPASRAPVEFEAAKGMPSRAVQAWQATLQDAAANAGKRDTNIGYVIHDAHNTHPDSSNRIGNLAQTLTTEIPEFDFLKQTFNTPALLGEMGAGTSLTNMALAIAYANHIGQHVLVAGTTDQEHPTAVLIQPPAIVRPINHDAPWFRARGEGNAYLMWWGARHDAPPRSQGYSY